MKRTIALAPGHIFLFAFLVLHLACVSKYRLIDPLALEYQAPPDTLSESGIEITYQYHVLEQAGNKKYAKNEKRTRVSLLGVLIANRSDDTLFFPEDLLMLAQGDTLYPLFMEEAGEVLAQYHEYDPGESGFWDWLFIYLIPEIAMSAKEAKANKRFFEELDQYYLVYSTIPPGATVSGLLALPVKKDVPLEFQLLPKRLGER